jgi:putative addiction module component (TIGR02574 family)
MNDRVLELAEQTKSLSAEQRVRLLDLVLESLEVDEPTQTDAAWAAEIERRVGAHERGEGKLYDLEEVMAEAAKIAP